MIKTPQHNYLSYDTKHMHQKWKRIRECERDLKDCPGLVILYCLNWFEFRKTVCQFKILYIFHENVSFYANYERIAETKTHTSATSLPQTIYNGH